jgi:hypothetical protein
MYKDFQEMATRIVDALRPIDETVERIQKGLAAINWQVDTLILSDSKGINHCAALRHNGSSQFWSINRMNEGVADKIGDIYGDAAAATTFMLLIVNQKCSNCQKDADFTKSMHSCYG